MVTLSETRHGRDGGSRWEAAVAQPAAGLDGLITGYGGFHEESVLPVTRQELPSPSLVLLLSLTEPLSLSRRTIGMKQSCAALVGVGRELVVAAHTGSQSVLEVRLSPLAAITLFDVTASELTDQIVDLAELWPGTPELLERVRTASTWADRFQLIEASLIARAGHGHAVDTVLTGAWRQLLNSHGDLGMRVLHDQTGWSRKRLAERFRTGVGLPPKAMAGLVRFQHALDLLRRPGHCSLASVALACGYYDQAHLNREFKELAGCTPTAFLLGLDTDATGTAMGSG